MASMVQALFILSLCLSELLAAKVRPCPDLGPSCIGSYLQSNSTCSVDSLPTDKTGLDPFYLDYFYFTTPYFNVTEDRYNISITGHSQTYVYDFFYNEDTNKVVLTLFCPNVTFEGDTILHLWSENDDVPKNVSTHYYVSFANMTLTTIFPVGQSLELEGSTTFPNITVPPTFANGEGLAEAAAVDTQVAYLDAAYNADPYVATLEAFVFRGPALAKLYIDYMLCYYA